MAELLVKTYDQVNPNDVHLDVQCDKRGHVITIQTDGWQWGPGEAQSGEFTIIKIPGVPVNLLSAFLAMEPGRRDIPNLLQNRAFSFDLDMHQISPAHDLASLMALKKTNPPRLS